VVVDMAVMVAGIHPGAIPAEVTLLNPVPVKVPIDSIRQKLLMEYREIIKVGLKEVQRPSTIL
jgi:hypothetical protein